MRLHLFTIGKIKDRRLQAKFVEYVERIRFTAQIEHVALRDGDPASEGRRLIEALDRFRRAKVIVLSEEGRQYSSREFAALLAGVDTDCVLVVGGPEGLAPAVKQRADLLLSLSPMTFPHELAAVMLVEQLFRAQTIIGKRGYHK